MHRKRFSLFLFVLIVLGIMTYQSTRQPLAPFRFLSGVLNVFYEAKDSTLEFFRAPFRRMFLREEENRKLRAEVSRLMQEEQKWQEAFRENERLRALLALRDIGHAYVASARVIARGTDQWSHTFVIDKGLQNGIRKDMVAVTDKGLVGKISDVSSSYAHLLLMTDITFSSAARLRDKRTEGVLSGTGFRTCQLKYVPYDEEVKTGDVVVTSGLDSLFPPGIPIGSVSNVSKREGGMFPFIEVVPFVDNSKVEVVAIIRRA